MEKRYTALRTIGTIYKVLGVIVGAMTILVALGICASSIFGGAAIDSLSRELGRDVPSAGMLGGILGGLLLGILAIIYGGGLAITLYAAGESVYLLIALEENTRATAMFLQQQFGSHST